MDDREQARLQLGAAVMKLTRHRGFRDALVPLREDGIAPFVVGLLDDTLGEIGRRTDTLGGSAHLIVFDQLSGNRARLRILSIQPGRKPIAELDDQHDCLVNEDSTLEILMEHIEVGGELTYYAYDSETVIRFLTDSVARVPA